MMTDTSHKGESVSIFSPAETYLGSIRKMSKGAHHMVLTPRSNAAYEDEVVCSIDGVPVGILHDDQTYYYHRQLSILKDHGIELVTPCQITEHDVVYFQPLQLKHLKEWVAERIGSPDDPRVQNPVDSDDDREPLLRLSTDQAARVSARIGRHLVHLASRDWFDPQDAATMARFAYALYGYDNLGVADRLSPKQEEALVLSAYALHRSAPHLLDYDKRVILGTDDYAQSVAAQAVSIRDTSVVKEIVDRALEAQSVVQELVGGKIFAAEMDEPEDETLVLPSPSVVDSSVATIVRRPAATSHAAVRERRERILALVAEGMVMEDIVRAMGIQESTVRNDLRLLDVDVSLINKKRDQSGSRDAAALALHRQGKNTEEIAEILHLTYAQAWYALRSVE